MEINIENITNPDLKRLSTKDRISVETFRILRETQDLNITISEICKATGITKSTFYYYFHSVDEVIETFSDIITMNLTNFIPKIFEQHTCIEQALMAIRIVDECVETLGVAVAASRYIMHLKKGDYAGFHTEAGWELVLSILKKAVEVGELSNTRSPEEYASSVYFIMRGVNHTWCMQGGNFPFTEKVQTELRLYFDAISSDKG